MARANGTPGVLLTDDEQQRIRLTVASNAVPLPYFDLLPIADPNRKGYGFLLIAVPRSLSSPHAVIVNEGFRYPKRNGTTTRFLTESEVATAYRDRFAAARRGVERVEKVEADAITHLGARESIWLIVTLAADLPGDMMVDRQTLAEFRQQAVSMSPMITRSEGYTLRRVTVGQRRLIADDSMNSAGSPNSIRVELHGDGSGVFAMRIMDLREHLPMRQPGDAKGISDEQVVYGLLSALRYLALHARDRAHAGGNATLKARILPTGPLASLQLFQVHPRGFINRLGEETVSREVVSEDHVVSLDSLASEGPSLVSAAYLIASDMFQPFGFPDATQVTSDGGIRENYWGIATMNDLRAWADAEGVPVRAETVPR